MLNLPPDSSTHTKFQDAVDVLKFLADCKSLYNRQADLANKDQMLRLKTMLADKLQSVMNQPTHLNKVCMHC